MTELQKKLAAAQVKHKDLINLATPDFTFYPSLLNQRKIERSLVNIVKYPYYYPFSRGDETSLDAIADYYRQKKITIEI